MVHRRPRRPELNGWSVDDLARPLDAARPYLDATDSGWRGRTAKVTSSCPVTDGEGWVSGHPGTFLLSLGEAFELGRCSLGRLVDAEARR